MPIRQYTGKIEETLVNTERFSVFKVSHFKAIAAIAAIAAIDARFDSSTSKKPSIAVCTLGSQAPDEPWVLLTGNWRKHPTYGWRFAVDRVSPSMPQDAEAIRDYLRSGEVDLIGEELADRLVDRFGDQNRALGWVERRLLIVGNKETLEAILKNRPVENQRPVLDYIQELSPSQG